MDDTRPIEYVIAFLLVACLAGILAAAGVWYVGGFC
jgi:hypothetical protein